MEPGTSIRAWLALPPGPWPPDHYALLAVPPGTGDLAEIEARVLDRMELLRQHQVLHPDAVTEGMNRLAQALVCLTDPVARAAYDRGLGLAPAPFEVVEDDAPEEAREPTFAPGPPPQHLPYEVVDPVPVAGGSLPYEVVPEGPAAEELPPPAAGPADPPPGPHKAIKLKRRTIYRRLAALRRAVRAWEALRPVLGGPGEALSTPVGVLMFLQAVTTARAALPGVAFVFDGAPRAGGVVAALARLPTVLPTVRGLLPSQREKVARDWRAGYHALLRERDHLRGLARGPRARRRARSRLQRAVRRTPELVLVALAVVIITAAALRRAHWHLSP